MVKCHLSKIMGERRIKISDLARDTGINRGTLTRLYHETAERIELEVIDALCTYFSCSISDLLEHVPEAVPNREKTE
ncbi:helix-turn-helix transcriptional regulator [Chitinibacter bivalviorum]|uniref:Helix-turn-helix transcriptional regulator n=1 Tax=Chitinibacter bivalviorum TaxID=2739434 RepID=A0A7H9BLU4_9NEIS|nr:helix-turn-helix transcriptional regulator [Chitinibacter bivalviorum]